jgi:hypothetical protein
MKPRRAAWTLTYGGVGLKNEALEGMDHFDKEQDLHQVKIEGSGSA